MINPLLGMWVLVTARLVRHREKTPDGDREPGEDYLHTVVWSKQPLAESVSACIVDITHRHDGNIDFRYNRDYADEPELEPVVVWTETRSVPCLMVRERPGRAAYEVPMDGWSPLADHCPSPSKPKSACVACGCKLKPTDDHCPVCFKDFRS